MPPHENPGAKDDPPSVTDAYETAAARKKEPSADLGQPGRQTHARPSPVPEGSLLDLLTAGIDRDTPIPLNVQVRGVIEYGILMGSLPPGTRLPTVREFAEGVGIATMTVVSVYNKLKGTGLIQSRGRAGTFVTEGNGLPTNDGLRRLNQAIDDLLTVAGTLGLDAIQMSELIGVRGNLLRARSTMPVRILFVGLFEKATADYAQFIQERIVDTDRVEATTIHTLPRQDMSEYDLILTLANRQQEVLALLSQSIPVLGINFVPSVETRTRLAGLDATARVGIVSTFPEFAGLMRLNVLRFISHVSGAAITSVDATDLESFVRTVDVVVYATGSERVCDMVTSRQLVIEYRHSPDPNNIKNDLLPLLEDLRAAKQLRS